MAWEVSMIARYSASAGVGTAVTFGLLFIMQLLIATGADPATDGHRFPLGNFVLVERNTVIETTRDKPEKPQEIEDPPDTVEPNEYDEFENTITVAPPEPTRTRVNIRGSIYGQSDGEYLPIVKVAPVYPSRALARGLEGYVIVEFTVTRTGTVRDVYAVESTNSLFDRAAIDAAMKFKYKPRIIDGEAVEVPGVLNKISFAITE